MDECPVKSLYDIPDDLLPIIFNLLPIEDIISLFYATKQFNTIILKKLNLKKLNLNDIKYTQIGTIARIFMQNRTTIQSIILPKNTLFPLNIFKRFLNSLYEELFIDYYNNSKKFVMEIDNDNNINIILLFILFCNTFANKKTNIDMNKDENLDRDIIDTIIYALNNNLTLKTLVMNYHQSNEKILEVLEIDNIDDTSYPNTKFINVKMITNNA